MKKNTKLINLHIGSKATYFCNKWDKNTNIVCLIQNVVTLFLSNLADITLCIKNNLNWIYEEPPKPHKLASLNLSYYPNIPDWLLSTLSPMQLYWHNIRRNRYFEEVKKYQDFKREYDYYIRTGQTPPPTAVKKDLDIATKATDFYDHDFDKAGRELFPNKAVNGNYTSQERLEILCWLEVRNQIIDLSNCSNVRREHIFEMMNTAKNKAIHKAGGIDNAIAEIQANNHKLDILLAIKQKEAMTKRRYVDNILQINQGKAKPTPEILELIRAQDQAQLNNQSPNVGGYNSAQPTNIGGYNSAQYGVSGTNQSIICSRLPQQSKFTQSSSNFNIRFKFLGSEFCTLDEFDYNLIPILFSSLYCFYRLLLISMPSFEVITIIVVTAIVILFYKGVKYCWYKSSCETRSKIKMYVYKAITLFFFAVFFRYDIKLICNFDVLKEILHPISLFYYFIIATHSYLFNLIITNKPFILIRAFITILISTACILMARYVCEYLVLMLQDIKESYDLLEYINNRLNEVNCKNNGTDKDNNGVSAAAIVLGIRYSTLSNKSNILNVKSKTNKSSLEINGISIKEEENLNTYLAESENLNRVSKAKHFPPANKEWTNSAYSYNNSIPKNFPVLDKVLSKVVRGYFNLYTDKLRRKIRKHRTKRFEIKRSRRLINRVLIGKPELKHNNDNIVVTVYIYNAEKKHYARKIKKIPAIYKSDDERESNILRKKRGIYMTKVNKAKTLYIKKTNKVGIKIKSKLNKYRKIFLFINRNKVNYKKFLNINRYKKRYFKKYVRKCFRKETISVFHKQMHAFNRSKFENKYVMFLANNLQQLYNKKIKFNFVSLKHMYFDSSIFSKGLIIKLRTLSKKKKNFLIGLRKFLTMFKVPPINTLQIYNDIYKRPKINQNINNVNIKSNFGDAITPINLDNPDYSEISWLEDAMYNMDDIQVKENLNYTFDSIKGDILDNTLNISKYITNIDFNKYKHSNIARYSYIINRAFTNVKYKILNGIRLEIAGRFTKRASAARSVFKIRNKGSVKNRNSSLKGLPTVVLKGYAKSNLQFNKLYSKVRGGSFGLKSWLSGA